MAAAVDFCRALLPKASRTPASNVVALSEEAGLRREGQTFEIDPARDLGAPQTYLIGPGTSGPSAAAALPARAK
jgi:hypothetical protein